MKKHEQYNLIFKWTILSNGLTKRYVVSNTASNQYEPLTFINALEQVEIQTFIDNITLANNGQLYDPDFYKQQGTEAFTISFIEPNFNIEGLIISMLDVQQLLQEWLTYLNDTLV